MINGKYATMNFVVFPLYFLTYQYIYNTYIYIYSINSLLSRIRQREKERKKNS